MFFLLPFSRFRGIVSPIPVPEDPSVPTDPGGGTGGGGTPVDPPTNTTPPSITGTYTVGSTLTANHGAWTGNPTDFVYIWKSGGNTVGTSDTYVIQQSDVGATITLTVYCSNAGGASQQVTVSGGTVTSVGLLPLNAKLVWIGDSNTDEDYAPTGYARIAQMLLGGRYRVDRSPLKYNQGVAGTAIQSALDYFPNVQAIAPDVIVMMYGTNDGRNIGTPTFMQKYTQAVANFKSIGAKVVAIGVPPGGTEYPVPQYKKDANLLISQVPGLDGYIDPYDYMVLGDSPDTHFSDSGKAHLGKGVADKIGPFITSDSIYSLTGFTNICAGETFSGAATAPNLTGGNTIVGVPPTGWNWVSFQGDATNTVTFSLTTQNGKPAFKIAMVNGSVKQMSFTMWRTYGSQAVGDIYEGWLRILMEGDQTYVGLGMGNSHQFASYASISPVYYPTPQIWRVEADTVTQAGELRVQFNVTCPLSSSTAFTISEPVMFKK